MSNTTIGTNTGTVSTGSISGMSVSTNSGSITAAGQGTASNVSIGTNSGAVTAVSDSSAGSGAMTNVLFGTVGSTGLVKAYTAAGLTTNSINQGGSVIISSVLSSYSAGTIAGTVSAGSITTVTATTISGSVTASNSIGTATVTTLTGALQAGTSIGTATVTNMNGTCGPFATSMALSAPAVDYGQAGLVTVTITCPSFKTPLTGGGNVSLTVDQGTAGAASFSGVLVNGVYTFNVGLLADGTHSLSVSYPTQTAAQGAGQLKLLSSGASGSILVKQSIYVLNGTSSGAATVSGNAAINVPGILDVDSTSSTALTASGNAMVTATSGIQVVGGFSTSGNAKLSPKPVKIAAVSDPLAGLAQPSVSGSSQGAVSVSGNASKTINPGIYSQISVSGNGTLIMNPGPNGTPGIYVIAGGGFSISGNGSVSGSNVLIYNAGSNYSASAGTDGGTFGAISLSGNATLTGAACGPYAGVVFFQARDNTQALSLSGNVAAGIKGTIYAASASVSMSGNAKLNDSLVAGTLNVSGNGILNALSSDATAYTPAQIRSAYGISVLPEDGTGQTIAIVDAYDNPNIFQSVDAFDSLFGATSSGQSLYEQYGSASSFLTVLNQNGQAGPLPVTDPSGAGTDNWEVESALDVEWVHAVAPGANIVLVEANSQSLSDLMSSVATAAGQPGVSVVSMSWGFTEGQAVLAADEAAFDQYLTTPAGHQGVTFVASTGDYGTNNPEYPAFSPNVVAVGGTSLTLNSDDSYNSETGWGYNSGSAGTLIAGGGGLSQYESEPAYQQAVQSTGYRTTPDVSFVADPNTGAWIADTYNLSADSAFEVVGGTSLSAPSWAGMFALVNQGRTAAGLPTLNSSSPTEAQQDLYSLSQSDYNVIASGTNGGYNAAPGYNLVTGLGTPVADQLVPDMVAGNYPTTGQVAPIAPGLNANSGYNGSGSGGTTNVINVFAALTATGDGIGNARDSALATSLSATDLGVTRHATPLEVQQPSASLQPPELLAVPNSGQNVNGSFVFFRATEAAAPAAGFDPVSQVRYASITTDGVTSSSERRAREVFFAGAGSNRAEGSARGPDSFAAASGRSRTQRPMVPVLDAVFLEASGSFASGAPLAQGGPTAQPLEDWAGAPPAGEEERGNALLAGIFAGATLQDLARVLCDHTGAADAEKQRRRAALTIPR